MKYDYAIYQTENDDYTFMGFDYAMNHGFSQADYQNVYSGEIEASCINEALELLFEKFNIHHPADYKGRSLSVSDLVYINRVPYYCDRFGWSEVPFDR